MLSNKRRREYPKGRPTNVTLLLDMSGSMGPRRDETIREVNRYLNDLKDDGQRYKLSVVTFNEGHDYILTRQDIRDVGRLEHSEYRPNGWTRLLDAVGSVLNSFQYDTGRNLFCVITDGQENDSRNYGLQEVRDMIDRRRGEDFQFVFLGSGPGSWTTGRNLGFNISVSTDWSDPRNSENIYRSLYTASNSMSKGGPIGAQMFNTGSTSAQNTQFNKDTDK